MGLAAAVQQHTTHTAFGDGAEMQASGHAYTVPEYSPTSALCKHLPAVLWTKFSSHKVSVQLHSKWHQCRCVPLAPDVHRVTQILIGKGGGRRKEVASTFIYAPPRRGQGVRLAVMFEGKGGQMTKKCSTAKLQFSSLAFINMKPDDCTSGKKCKRKKSLKKQKHKHYTFQRKQNLLAYGAFCWDSTWIHAPKH